MSTQRAKTVVNHLVQPSQCAGTAKSDYYYTLTPEEIQFYNENGYLVVRNLFTPEECDVWQSRFLDIVNGKIPKPERMLVMKDVQVAKGEVKADTREKATAKVQDFENDKVLFSYAIHPKSLDIVEQLVGSKSIKSIHTMLINKPGGVDGRHPLHQDLFYFPFRPAHKICASWTSLEPVHRENGCLSVVPGSHLLDHGKLQKHAYPSGGDWGRVNHAYFGIEKIKAHPQRVHCEMGKGDTVFFHPLIYHGSGRNRTDGYRKAISAHYASADCYFVDDNELKEHLNCVPEDYHQMVKLIHAGVRPYTLVRGKPIESQSSDRRFI